MASHAYLGKAAIIEKLYFRKNYANGSTTFERIAPPHLFDRKTILVVRYDRMARCEFPEIHTTVFSVRAKSVEAFGRLIGGDIPPAFVLNTCSTEEITPQWVEKNFHASRIISRAIFPGKTDALDRLLQLAGKTLTPAEFIQKIVDPHFTLILQDRAIFTFLEMFIWLDSIGHGVVDSNLFRAIHADVLTPQEAHGKMNHLERIDCSTCSLISKKSFNAHFKIGNRYFDGTIIVGREGDHVCDVPSWRAAEKFVSGVILDVGHITHIRCTANYRRLLKKDRTLMWSHRVFRHFVFHSALVPNSEAYRLAELIVNFTSDELELKPFRHLAARLLMERGFSGLPPFQEDDAVHECVESFEKFVSSVHSAFELRSSDRSEVDDWISKFCT